MHVVQMFVAITSEVHRYRLRVSNIYDVNTSTHADELYRRACTGTQGSAVSAQIKQNGTFVAKSCAQVLTTITDHVGTTFD